MGKNQELYKFRIFGKPLNEQSSTEEKIVKLLNNEEVIILKKLDWKRGRKFE